MPVMKPNFSKSNLLELINFCIGYVKLYNTFKHLFISAIAVIIEYKTVYENIGSKMPEDLKNIIEQSEKLFPENTVEPQMEVTKGEMFRKGEFYYAAYN